MKLGRLVTPLFCGLLLAVPLFAYQAAAEKGRPVTDEERAALIAQLERTRDLLRAATRGLTPAQATYKTATDRWSVLECVEHLALTEPFLFGFSQNLLKSPAKPAKAADELKAGDEKVLKGVADRTQKAQAPEPARPTGKFANLTAALEAYNARRAETIEYVRITQDDLRSHSFQMGPTEMDDYQLLLMLAAHTERHTAQINEVKASVGFPKEAR
jgi:hypothetical protein